MLFFSFQDEEHLYFALEYIPGGDLMALLIRKHIFKYVFSTLDFLSRFFKKTTLAILHGRVGTGGCVSSRNGFYPP